MKVMNHFNSLSSFRALSYLRFVVVQKCLTRTFFSSLFKITFEHLLVTYFY